MELKQFGLTAKEAAGKEPAPPKKYLDKIRKNLFDLLCQSDEKELIGGVSDFGGKEDVGNAIAKAVMNLFALGASFDVDVAASIEKIMPGKKEPTAGTDIPKASAAKAEPKAQQPAQPPKAEQGSGSKATKIQMYKNSFDSAKTKSEVEKIWRSDVVPDKSLTGVEKAGLGKYKDEAKKQKAE